MSAPYERHRGDWRNANARQTPLNGDEWDDSGPTRYLSLDLGGSTMPRSEVERRRCVEMGDTAPAASRMRLAAEVVKRRNAEGACALHFLVYGADEHETKCVNTPPCSRDYDPAPEPECAPADPGLYEGTGIAAIYDLPGGEAHAWQLAGWNLRRGA